VTADGSFTADLARTRAASERRRAARAAGIARRSEALAKLATGERRALHTTVAATHRRLEQCHRTAASLHDRHADLLERWAAADRREPEPPAFITSVAGSLGSRSVAISLRGRSGAEALVVASDKTARAAQDLEFVLGEGPSRDASDGGSLVVAAGGSLVRRWPQYGAALAGLGVLAVASAPLAVPDRCLGALTVLDPHPGMAEDPGPPLRTVADTLIQTMLLTPEAAAGAAGDGALPDSPLLDGANLRAVVHQAAGMVSVQNECTVATALDLIRAHAFAEGRSIDAVSASIVDRHLRLD
jgi:hypothetical protein